MSLFKACAAGLFPSGLWWSWTESNRRPPACKAGALPIELQPLLRRATTIGVGQQLTGKTALKAWWAWVDSNYRPHAYQACALTGLSYRPPRLQSTYDHGRTLINSTRSRALDWRKRNEGGNAPRCFVEIAITAKALHIQSLVLKTSDNR